MEAIKRYKKMWDEISQMFLIGSFSEITVFGDVSREYLVDKPDKSGILNTEEKKPCGITVLFHTVF